MRKKWLHSSAEANGLTLTLRDENQNDWFNCAPFSRRRELYPAPQLEASTSKYSQEYKENMITKPWKLIASYSILLMIVNDYMLIWLNALIFLSVSHRCVDERIDWRNRSLLLSHSTQVLAPSRQLLGNLEWSRALVLLTRKKLWLQWGTSSAISFGWAELQINTTERRLDYLG